MDSRDDFSSLVLPEEIKHVQGHLQSHRTYSENDCIDNWLCLYDVAGNYTDYVYYIIWCLVALKECWSF